MFEQVYDLAIVGGGLTGTAIARDAAGRGLSVFLCERGDLGGSASSATDRLIHGGLHHVGRLEWAPLRTALVEREILLRAAPHLVRPVRFTLPHHDGQWPRWAIGLGLMAHDRLARRSLPPARRLDLHGRDADQMLRPLFGHGFAFCDCVADNSRLVVANAMDARQRGASINPRLACVVAERERQHWRLSLESEADGEWTVVFARILVNATGADSGGVLDHVIHTNRRTFTRLTRHSQIVVRRPHDGKTAYALPNADGRMVHAVPHEPGFMLIGSARNRRAEEPVAGDVQPRDVAYLIDAANQYFHEPIERDDIVQKLACLTAMPADVSSNDGDHAVIVDTLTASAPLLSVFGGALTTHRLIAEELVDRLARFRKVGPPWTADAALPGGNFPPDVGASHLCLALRAAYPFLSEDHAHRLVMTYGTRAPAVLTGARSLEDLGQCFGVDLTAAEVTFLRGEEWAMTAEDVLWRRTRLGLRFTQGQADALADWMGQTAAAGA